MEKRGLTNVEAHKRIKIYGPNEIKELLRISLLQILLRQIKKNFVIYVLLIAVLLSFLVGKDVTAYTILGVIVIVITVGFFQEYKSEKAIKALKQILVPISIVIRDGKEVQVASKEIVPGDLVVLRTGEKVPADCIILEERELHMDESILTGESQSIKKLASKNGKTDDKESLVYMGTYVVSGRCIANVLHTGMNTEFGKIAGMISTAEKELPLQKKVNNIAKYMVFVAVFVSILTGAIMLLRNLPLSYDFSVEVLIVVIALSVSAFPEGLPVVLISTLASGAYRMSKKNAIVNRMSIIETLGETTVICADKTGTITKGEMTAKQIFCDGKTFEVSGTGYNAEGNVLYDHKLVNVQKNASLNLLLKTAILCNDANIERKGTDKEYSIIGTPTEAAMLIMAAKAGIFKEDLHFTRKEEIPFSSERKMMTVLCKEDRNNLVYSKGAPEILINQCSYMQKNNKIVNLDKIERERILKLNNQFTSQRFRVLALAYKTTASFEKDHVEQNLVFLGLVALEDPPRDEVKPALKLCRDAGIKVKMITGDNKETAIQIAKEIGLNGDVITGDELDKLTDEELSQTVNKIAIFARVRIEHKLRIIIALKQNKEIVAMTGDGVNDAPALKEAHIGIAMGKSGTDITREIADLTLKDDNFATIVLAISEGRTIFSNIRKFTTHALSCNYAELFVIFFGILFGLPLPLLALQILFMNIVTDDLTEITLGFNPASKDVMKTKPRKESNILNKQLIFLLIVAGTIMGAVTLGAFYFTLEVLHQDIAIARTVGLVTLIFFEIANAFNFRSFRHPVHKLDIFANKYLVYASVASVLATLLVVYTLLNKIFETAHIAWYYFAGAALISLTTIIVFDIWKRIKGDLMNGN